MVFIGTMSLSWLSPNSGSGKISLIIVKGGYVDCVFTPVKWFTGVGVGNGDEKNK